MGLFLKGAKVAAKTSKGGLGAITDAGRIAHEQQAAARAAENARIAELIKTLPPRAKSTGEKLGQYHPVGGGTKLSKPFDAMHVTKVPDPEYKQPGIRAITPEQLVKERAAIYPLIGDRADTGNYLTHVGETELARPVRLTGGSRYMDANYNLIDPEQSSAWESGKGVVGKLANRSRMAAEMDRQPVGVYVAGSGTNTDFNIMGTNAILQQLHQGKFTKKAAKAFDQEMKARFPQWKGLLSPDTEHMLLDKSNGELRKAFIETMAMEPHQKAGLPDVPHTRKAITDEALMHVPTHEAGFRLAHMSPEGRIIENPQAPSDYPISMAGKLKGTLDKPMDYKLLWPSHFEERRLLSQPESGDYYSFNRAAPIQIADQEWLDKVMAHRREMERKEREGSYKQGGLAHLGRGGQPHKKKTTVAEDIKSFKEPAKGLADMMASALRGSVAATVGLPGDIESLGRGARAAYNAPSGKRLEALGEGLEQPTILPNTEKMKEILPRATDYDNPYESLGEFMPLPGSGAAVKALGRGAKRAAKATAKHAGQAISDAMIHQTGPLAKGPLSMLAPQASTMHVIKPKGGNWLTGDVEKALEPLKTDLGITNYADIEARYGPERAKQMLQDLENSPHFKQSKAINDWVNRNLTNYIKKEMATPEDPVRKLAEQGITHKSDLGDFRTTSGTTVQRKREQAGFPAEGMGQSDLAKQWENLADYSFSSRPAKDVSDKRYPWVSKLDPETPVYGGYHGVGNRELGFDHIVDVLRQDVREGRIRPEQLNKVSMEQAVRRAYEFDQEQARKMAETALKQQEGFPIHKEYPEGYKWIELAKSDKLPEGYTVDKHGNAIGPDGNYVQHPGEKMLEDALKYEGDTMGHCVGGYCPDVLEGRSRIFSLRDKKGEPHVTVEVAKGQPRSEYEEMNRIYDQVAREANEKNFDTSNEYQNFYHSRVKELQMDMLDKKQAAMPERIVQIKGKQNRAPKEEYLPFVQDFVRGGKWSDVGDLHNTGLIEHSGRYFTDPELIEAAKKYGRMGVEDTPWEVARQRHVNNGIPEEEALRNWVEAFKEGRGKLEFPPEQGMKNGGVAHMGAGGLMAKGFKVAAPLVKPSTLTELENVVRQSHGAHGAKRVQRAADEIPNLENMYKAEALKRAFTGDNAKGLMTMNPADFEKYATVLTQRPTGWKIDPSVEPVAGVSKYDLPTDEYIRYLSRVGGFEDVPFLQINKEEQGLPLVPFISGHEGRHRSRALAHKGEKTSLVQLVPNSEMREPFPRRTNEEYLEALKRELAMTKNMVTPQSSFRNPREAIELPDVYSQGGSVHDDYANNLVLEERPL